MDAQIRILALIHIALAGLALLVGLGLVVILASGPQTAESRAALQFVGPLYALIGGFTLLPELIGGIGLLAQRAWARWVIVILSVPYLFAFPVGTALGVFGLRTLLRRGFPGHHAAQPTIIVRAPRLRRDQVNVLLAMAGVGAGFAVVLWVGFALDHHSATSGGPVLGPNGTPIPIYRPPAAAPPFNSNPTGALLAGLAVLAIAAVLAMLCILRPVRARRNRRRIIARMAERNAGRIAELEADPIRRPYAALVAKGAFWSNEQIDYDLDFNAVATCIHLQPIERRMRRAGINVRLIEPLVVRAQCQVDKDEMERRSLLVPPAIYWEYFETERSREDNPSATLCCLACRTSAIRVINPLDAKPGTSRFGG